MLISVRNFFYLIVQSYYRLTAQFLNQKFGNKWIGYLFNPSIPLDFLWEYVKDKVMFDPSITKENMKQICNACASIDSRNAIKLEIFC